MTAAPARVALIIPTLNAERHLNTLIPAIASLTPSPDEVLVIDSASDDATRELVSRAGFRVHVIARADFGHGSTRNLGAALVPHAEFLLFMTQDAVPASPDLVAAMIRPFQDERIAQVFARQLPRADARPAARFARIFNYPPESYCRSLADLAEFGARAVFSSNSCAAYRRTAFEAIGGFPEKLPAGEDMAIAGRLLQAGHLTCYCAEALVIHSHNYSIAQEFRRYFDIGTLHAVDPWFQRHRMMLRARDGSRYLRAEYAHTVATGTTRDVGLLPFRQMGKWLGYRSGRLAPLLPLRLNRRLSMQSHYWKFARADDDR